VRACGKVTHGLTFIAIGLERVDIYTTQTSLAHPI